jgi:hypothetical protein
VDVRCQLQHRRVDAADICTAEAKIKSAFETSETDIVRDKLFSTVD